jgi:hypothetical protein
MTALVKQEQRLTSLEEMQAFAEVAVRSKFYGFKTADEMLPLMIIAQSEGRSFASVVQEYDIISGKPSLKAEAMLARFQKSGGHIQWTELSDTRCAAIFSHPQCSPVEIDWDMARAKQAQIKNHMWAKYPRNMLKARVISDGVRTSFPACLGGMYTPEEVSDFEPARQQVSPPPARGQLAAPENAGQHEPSREPPSSLKHSFTGDSEPDGLPKGKSAHAARKNGDWERVSERLDEELKDCATKAEAMMWWEKVRTTDEEYQALPQDWRKTYRDEHYLPVLAGLDDEAEVVAWEDDAGARG